MGLAPEDPEALREGMSKSWVGAGVNPDPFQVQKELAQSDLSASLTTCPPVLSLTHPNYGGLEHRKPAPASGSFPMNRLFALDGQSFGASASVFPMSIQG